MSVFQFHRQVFRDCTIAQFSYQIVTMLNTLLLGDIKAFPRYICFSWSCEQFVKESYGFEDEHALCSLLIGVEKKLFSCDEVLI